MRSSGKTEITVETHRTLTIKGGSRHRFAWCEECGRQTQMTTADLAAIIAGVSSRAIYQLIEAREIHSAGTPDQVVFICLNSLESLS